MESYWRLLSGEMTWPGFFFGTLLWLQGKLESGSSNLEARRPVLRQLQTSKGETMKFWMRWLQWEWRKVIFYPSFTLHPQQDTGSLPLLALWILSIPLWLYIMSFYNCLLECLFLHSKATSIKSINAYFYLMFNLPALCLVHESFPNVCWRRIMYPLYISLIFLVLPFFKCKEHI